MKHKATWLACAVTISCEMWVLTHKPPPCYAIKVCGQFAPSNGTGVLSSPQTQSAFNSGTPITFTSSHSLTETRTDNPNTCSAATSVQFSNGYILGGTETTVTTGGCTLQWSAGGTGPQTCSATLTGSATITAANPTQYSAFVKTQGYGFGLDDGSTQFLVVPANL